MSSFGLAVVWPRPVMVVLVDSILSKYQHYLCSDSQRCDGHRHCRRTVTQYLPILVLRVYEHCLYDRTNIDDILSSYHNKIR